MSSPLFHANGVNADTGGYGQEPLSAEQIVEQFVKKTAEPDNASELQAKQRAAFPIKEGVDPGDLSQAGWGIVFPHKVNPGIKEALKPLLALRQAQAGERYREYEGGQGFRVGRDDKKSFTTRHKALGVPADPDQMPYYLLVIGDPDTVPYRFQYQMDVMRGVGRLDFGDDLDAYDRYARSVVEMETQGVKLPREMTFFGVKSDDDPSTQLSSDHLMAPLYEALSTDDSYKHWKFNNILGPDATRSRLESVLGGDETPAFLFTASHGMEFHKGDARQIPHQGALLCSDWPGPNNWRKAIPEEFFFSGEHLSSDKNLLGLISFLFACYGAGTPIHDEFAQQQFKTERDQIAERNFIASLPRQMLSLAGGGALAVVGHVERAWSCSFMHETAGPQITHFTEFAKAILRGDPVGWATEGLNNRYASLATDLTQQLEAVEFDDPYDPYEVAMNWTSHNDARGYVVLGDPAVRLPLAKSTETPDKARPSIDMSKSLDEVLAAYSEAASNKEEIVRPEEISVEDWNKTPFAVRKYIHQLGKK